MRQCAFCTAINGPLLCSIHTYNRQNDATLHQKMIFFEKNADFRRTPFLHRGKSSVSAQYAFEKTLNTELKQRGQNLRFAKRKLNERHAFAVKRLPAQFQPHLVAVLRAGQTIQIKGNERIAHVAHHVSGSIVPQLNFVGIIGVYARKQIHLVRNLIIAKLRSQPQRR